MILNSIKAPKFAITTLAPDGNSYKYEKTIPSTKQITEIHADDITTCENRLKTRIEVSDGKIIRLEINKVPIRRIPNTIVIAVSSAITILYISVFRPVAFAKFSSKVIAKTR